MDVLVTGAAGFIGFHLVQRLLARGDTVVGVDNLNDYYSVQLKKDRLAQLVGHNGFSFCQVDFSDHEGLVKEVGGRNIPNIVHLGAQAGVRYSLDHPFTYTQSNVVGHLSLMELARHTPDFRHMVYASSSSVYGGNTVLPFSENDRVDTPVSLYAATKKSDELMSQCYSHLYRIPQTGLRFFTVYGPWGRPDMAMWIFTKAILEGKPIRVFNHGDMMRDFTYVDDIVSGVIKVLDNPPVEGGDNRTGSDAPHRVYNIGNHKAESLMHMIDVLENAIGVKAERQLEPMQPGDVKATYADIDAIRGDLGFEPTTSIEDGIPKFVAWYRQYHGV